MFLSILFFKRALKAFTRALQVTVNVTSVLQTQRPISNTGRTGCLCHEGFYKKPGLRVAPCKGNRRSRVLKFYLLI